MSSLEREREREEERWLGNKKGAPQEGTYFPKAAFVIIFLHHICSLFIADAFL
jgi:hypothetical protein